jgi:hypothetical protein
MGDPSPLVQAGGVAGMFVVLAGLVISVMRISGSQQKALMAEQRDLRRQCRRLQADNEWCERRQNILITTMNQHGIAVPDAVWFRPPDLEEPHA